MLATAVVCVSGTGSQSKQDHQGFVDWATVSDRTGGFAAARLWLELTGNGWALAGWLCGYATAAVAHPKPVSRQPKGGFSDWRFFLAREVE